MKPNNEESAEMPFNEVSEAPALPEKAEAQQPTPLAAGKNKGGNLTAMVPLL